MTMADIFDEVGTGQNQSGDIFDQVGNTNIPEAQRFPGPPPEGLLTKTANLLGEVDYKKIFNVGKDILGQAVTMPITYPMGLAAEVGGLFVGGKPEAQRREEIIAQQITPKMTEPESQGLMNAFGEGMNRITSPLREAGKYIGGKIGGVYDTLTGQPTFDPRFLRNIDTGKATGEYAGEKAGELLTYLLGGYLSNKIKTSEIWDKTPVRERGLLVQSLNDAVKANPGMTDSRIPR